MDSRCRGKVPCQRTSDKNQPSLNLRSAELSKLACWPGCGRAIGLLDNLVFDVDVLVYNTSATNEEESKACSPTQPHCCGPGALGSVRPAEGFQKTLGKGS